MKRHMAILLFAMLTGLSVLLNCSKQNDIKTIVIGGIFDLSGPTSDVGKEYAEGVIDYIRYINEKGGIHNRKIELLYKDCSYKISQADSWYEELKNKNVISIIGWGTGNTEALAPKITADKIPFISASYSEKLADGNKYPYNFIAGVSYSDQVKIALKFIKNRSKKEKPNVAFIYNDTAFGRSPFFPGGENFADNNGINVSEKIIIPLTGENAKEKLMLMNAEWGIVQQTATASLAIINALKKLNKAKKLILLNWAIDENIARKIKSAGSLEIYGAIPYGVWDDNLSAVKLLHQINKKYHPEIHKRSCRYIQGYINAKILLEAIERAGDNLTGENIKKKLESLHNFDTEASFNRVTYTERIHKASSSIMIYELMNGKLVPSSQLLISIEQKIWEEY